MQRTNQQTTILVQYSMSETATAVSSVAIASGVAARYIPAFDAALKPLSQYIVVSDSAFIKATGLVFLGSAVLRYIAELIDASVKSNRSLPHFCASLSSLFADLLRRFTEVFGGLTVALAILYVLSKIVV